MSKAISLARHGIYTTHPNPRVGCVIARDKQLLAEGWHEYTGAPHAEINALHGVEDKVSGATCYVSLEPCNHTGRTPPCTEALIKAGIERVVIAMSDPNPKVAGNGVKRLEQAGIKTELGLMQTEAEKLNPGYIKRMQSGKPYVRCKLAMSIDGRTALANGQSKWITGDAARKDVQKLRAQSSVIMTGTGTLISDDPQLNVRDPELDSHQPLRVIIDRNLKSPATARIFATPGRTLIFTESGTRIPGAFNSLDAEIIQIEGGQDCFLDKTLRYLASEEETNEILLESGAGLAGSMLAENQLDEVILYQATKIMGDSGRGLFHLPMLNDMNDIIEMNIKDIRRVGKDWKITLTPEKK